MSKETHSLKPIVYSALFFLIFNFCALVFISYAKGPEDASIRQVFSQANSAYKEAKYDAAIGGYEEILKRGFASGNLYYNLANSYFKKGELGEAVLNYERAKLLIPNDSDLKSNYDYTLSLLNLAPPGSGTWFLRTLDKISEGLTINFLTFFLSLGYIAAALILSLGMFWGRLKKFNRITLAVLIISFIFLAAALKRKIDFLNQGAVVINKEVEAKFEPLENATAYFKLSEGSSVDIIEETADWYKIKRPDGKIGWVNRAGLGLIQG